MAHSFLRSCSPRTWQLKRQYWMLDLIIYRLNAIIDYVRKDVNDSSRAKLSVLKRILGYQGIPCLGNA